MARKNINTTMDENLYKQIRILALQLDKNANDLLEEGMEYVLKKYTKMIEKKNNQKET